jgi:hypothetical protein
MKYTKRMLKNVGTIITMKNFQVMLLRAIGPATRRMISARYRPLYYHGELAPNQFIGK